METVETSSKLEETCEAENWGLEVFVELKDSNEYELKLEEGTENFSEKLEEVTGNINVEENFELGSEIEETEIVGSHVESSSREKVE